MHRKIRDEGMKKNVMIRIDEEIVKKAKNYGLNISKISENSLKELIRRIEAPINQNEQKGNHEKGLVDWAGFEPAASAMPRRRSYQTDLPARPENTSRGAA